MDKHLAAFPAKLVQEGLAGSALDGKEDVQDLIAKWTSQSSATAFPNAGCCSCNCSCSSVHHCTRTDSLSSQTLVAPGMYFAVGSRRALSHEAPLLGSGSRKRCRPPRWTHWCRSVLRKVQ